ncbi:MAG: hypothetical protein JXB06_14630, partial [Spirochaetales bacterium]|nr:hypothetical protein [Spirochaetales bacterium]
MIDLDTIRSARQRIDPYVHRTPLERNRTVSELLRSTWARLVAQLYEIEPLTCSRCDSPMRILAVITEPQEVKKILRHLVKGG